MAAASVNQGADPIIARAITGNGVRMDRSAPGFRLASQSGAPVSLATLRGKVLLLTFINPVCGEDCAAIARELRGAASLLGADSPRVDLVAIAATAAHAQPAFIRAFDREEDLTSVPDWLFLTGTLAQLQRVWAGYETVAPDMMVGMSGYGDVAFVIDANGRIREEIRGIPGPAVAAAQSSFAVLLAAAAARQTLTP